MLRRCIVLGQDEQHTGRPLCIAYVQANDAALAHRPEQRSIEDERTAVRDAMTTEIICGRTDTSLDEDAQVRFAETFGPPSRITSVNPPTLLAITGTPADMASSTPEPSPSLCVT